MSIKKTLLLVDGSSYLYRAWHALPNLRNAQGAPTGALYGVTAMLRRLAQDYKADYAACVFDAKGGSFRNHLYPDYKAHRPPMPPELAAQIAPIHDMVRALGWPVLVVPGVEADDVIGTLAHRAAQACEVDGSAVHTIISTGDKDIAQLVTDRVQLVNTMNAETLDAQGVLEKYGVRPEQMVDWLMLVGDAADNIPGVTKVGPKTAAKWLAAYGTLDNLIAHADDIPGVAGKNLREAIPNFALTRQLVTIRCDCEISGLADGLDGLLPRPPDTGHLRQLYETYGFRSWLRELDDDKTAGGKSQDPSSSPALSNRKTGTFAAGAAALSPTAPPPFVPAHYETLQTLDALQSWLARMQQAELVALDTETTSLDPMQARLVGLSFSVAPGQAAYLPLRHRNQGDSLELTQAAPIQIPFEEAMQLLRPWLENADAPKLLHNAKYDAHVLANEGITLRGIAHDTMLQAYVLESHRRVNLTELAQRWLGRSAVEYETLCGKGAKQTGFDEVALDQAAHYASEDADFTLQLHQVLYPKLAASGENANPQHAIYQLEVQVSNVLTTIERNGVCIDTQLLHAHSQELGQAMQTLQERAFELAGQPFNLNSPKQLGGILFERMKLPVVRKTAGGAPSTDEDVLTRLALDYPLPQVLLEYRTLAKLKSTYTDKLPRMVNPATGRVHTRYAQAAVVTGRLASSEPNLQNIPVRTQEGRRVRAAFVVSQTDNPGGKILSADYSQIELRVMAHVSKDANLQNAFARGEDIHRATAAEVFGVALADVTPEQRRAAKAINFGLIYGMGEFGLAANLGITRDAARAYIDRYFMRYPGVADYMNRSKEHARTHGWVQTVFGRRLWLPDLQGAGSGKSGPRLAAAERAAINAPMQGTAADLIKMAMVAVQRWLDARHMRSRLIMQVHDELVLEAPAEEVEPLQRELPALMCQVAMLDVPLVAQVGVGGNWEQAH